MSLYSEKVMEHFRNPKNVGELKDADGVGEVGNPTCGDIMKIFIKISKRDVIPTKEGSPPEQDSIRAGRDSSSPRNDKTEDYIADIKFQTFGCGAAVATSSMVTELAKGKTLDEAIEITNKDVAESLDGLPPLKMHCSNLAASALKKAILDFRSRQKN